MDVAAALPGVERGRLRERFDAIDDPDYRGAQDDEDFDYTWENFTDIRTFYEQVAEGGFGVLFTAM